MRAQAWAVLGATAVAILGLAGCAKPAGSLTGTRATPAQELGTVPAVATTPAPAPATTPAPAKPAVPSLTCAQLKNATLGSATVKYNGYPDGIPLADGSWSGEDGNTVTLTVCATGDLTGDGAVDGLAALKLDGGGTGKFYSIGAWRNVAGKPVFAALKDLDDRTPVQSIAIAAGKATVVYLTRNDGEPAAQISIRRTAVFTLSGATLTELSHTDVPYTP